MGTSFYEDTVQRVGDVPVYRFFGSLYSIHLYTADQNEYNVVLKTSPDLINEGFSFYAPGHTS